MSNTEKNQSTSGLSGMEKYFTENKRSLIIIGGAAAFLVAAFFAYIKFYKQPKEAEARVAMWKAEYYMEKDSFNLAINGDGENNGFLYIADEYSGTEAGNMASYYLGVCYLNTGEWDLAIEALEKVDLGDLIVSASAIGCIGDALMEKGDVEGAIAKYEEAAKLNENDYTTPTYLKKAAMACESLGNFEKATEYYQRIFDEFEGTSAAIDIEKYLYRAKNSIASK